MSGARYMRLAAAAAEADAAKRRAKDAEHALLAARFEIYDGTDLVAAVSGPACISFQRSSMTRGQLVATVRALVREGVISAAEVLS